MEFSVQIDFFASNTAHRSMACKHFVGQILFITLQEAARARPRRYRPVPGDPGCIRGGESGLTPSQAPLQALREGGVLCAPQ